MSEEEIIEELRTIRTLLAIDKEEELEELTSDPSEIQKEILERLSYTEWVSLSTSDIAEETDTGTTTVRRHRNELEEKNLITRRGEGSGTEYRKSSLLRAAESIGVLEE